MKTRIITASILLVAFLLLIWIDNFWLNYLLFGVVIAFAFVESLKIYNIEESKLIVIALFCYLLLSLSSSAPFILAICVIMLYLIVIASFLAYNKSPSLKPLLPFIYPLAPLFLLFSLYKDFGIAYFAWLLFAIIASDSGGYFLGKKFGKRAFSPSSPNKTLEGVAGALCCGTLFGTIFGFFFIEELKMAVVFKFSLIVVLFGIFGDLFESYLKRAANIKDSGSLFPGHGGMLDRIDGYLFGAVGAVLVLIW